MKHTAEELLKMMTAEEKAAQMVQIPYSHVGREEALRWARLGAGSFLHVLGDDAREVQKEAMEHSRLGIPVLFGIDAIHGHGLNDRATIFPSQLAQACAWDPELTEKTGRDTAREVASDGLHWTFSPVLCLARDPRWGRVDETFGEDPFLAGELGAAIVRGYQGKDLKAPDSILACAKHYIAYGEATGARDAYDSELTWRKVRETLLPPFKKAAEAGCQTFMTAYGSIDGTPFTASRKALRELLRNECGFDGFVVTDWDNVNHMTDLQHTAENAEEASVIAAEAGNDMIMTTLQFYEAVLKALREGRLEESVLDEAVLHILKVKERMGLFDQPEKGSVPGCIGCMEHLEDALEAARESVTLLRNNGVLPFSKQVKNIALIGENADSIRAQYGDWTYFTHPLPDKEREGKRPYVTLKEGMEKLAKETGRKLVYARGCGVLADEQDDIPAAVRAARDADVIVFAAGDNVELFGEGHDRADLSLSGRQKELFEALCALGKPIVTVLIASKPLCLEKAAEADAVMVLFNGGMFGGQAGAEALFGTVNPSGRLPVSFPRHSGQVPVYYNYLDGWHSMQKYCDLPAGPLFAFGEGMGYTAFAYSDLSMDEETLTACVKVKNTGTLPGKETVQVYFRDEVSSVMTPVKNLCAFRKVTLLPGETKEVSFSFRKEDFSLVLPDERRVTEPGTFILMAGHSSRDEDLLRVRFRIG